MALFFATTCFLIVMQIVLVVPSPVCAAPNRTFSRLEEVPMMPSIKSSWDMRPAHPRRTSIMCDYCQTHTRGLHPVWGADEHAGLNIVQTRVELPLSISGVGDRRAEGSVGRGSDCACRVLFLKRIWSKRGRMLAWGGGVLACAALCSSLRSKKISLGTFYNKLPILCFMQGKVGIFAYRMHTK